MNTRSVTKNYHVEYVFLKNDLYNKNNIGDMDTSWIGKSRYVLVNIVKNCTDELVYSYKQSNEKSTPCNMFLIINGEEWWFGGRDVEHKIIINLNTGDLYDESIHINILGNLKKVFKWRDIEASPDGKTIIVSGYDNMTTNTPCTFRLFDISSIFFDGLIEIPLTHIIGIKKLYEFEKDSRWVTYTFHDNNSIIKKYWDYTSSTLKDTDDIIIFK